MRLRIQLNPPTAVAADIFLGYCPHCNAIGCAVFGDHIICVQGHKYSPADRELYPKYFCPHVKCTSHRHSTERRMNGNGKCGEGHQFKAADFVRCVLPQFDPRADSHFCPECNDYAGGTDQYCCSRGHKFPVRNALSAPYGGFCREPKAAFGFCPQCNAPSMVREKRIGGNDHCLKGHAYPSIDTLDKPRNPADDFIAKPES